MKVAFLLWVSLLGLMSVCTTVMAETAASVVTAEGTYVRAVPPGQPNSASFLTLSNKSSRDHALVSAESPIANVVELHTHVHDKGMMRMRQIDRIVIPAGGSVKLQPGGHHVMLIGLKQMPKPGDNADLTFVFEDGSKITVSAPVRKLQMKMKKGGMGGMNNMSH